MQERLNEILNAPRILRGNTFDDFTVGSVFEHHWGRTVTDSDNILFNSATFQINPIYFNAVFAKDRGHSSVVIAPMLVFSVVFGLSVEDLSERGGAFLGVDDLEYCRPVYPGDTLTARSTVTALRESRSDPSYGVATWHTEGFNQDNERVVHFKRSNLVVRAGGQG